MRVAIRTICIVLVIGLTGCTGGGGDGASSETSDPKAYADATTEELVEELRSEFDENNIAAMVEAFSRAGVTVYDDELNGSLLEVQGEQSALQLTEFQARNMALEISAGSGYAGTQLEALARGEKSPSISAGLIRYAGAGKTFGAELSSGLLTDEPKDPEATVFPTAVIALFLSDAAVEAGAEPLNVGTRTDHADDGTIVLAAGPDIQIAQEDEEDEVEEGEEGEEEEQEEPEEPAGGGGNICDQLSGFIGGTGRAILSSLIQRLPYVREVMLGLTLIVSVGSLFRSWSIDIAETPGSSHYGVGEKIEGEFVATIDSGGSFEWPAALQSCAALVGLELPEPTDAPGSEITWKAIVGIPRHLKLTGPTTGTVDESSKAVMPFEIEQEDTTTHEGGGEEQIGAGQIEATVPRQDVDRFVRLIGQLAGEFLDLPGIGSVANEIAGEIAKLASVSGYGVVIVQYHELLTASVVWEKQAARFELHTCEGPRGPWKGTLTYGGVPGSPLEFQFPDGSNSTDISGSFTTPAGSIAYSGTATLIGTRALEFNISGTGAGTAIAPINYGPVAECR